MASCYSLQDDDITETRGKQETSQAIKLEEKPGIKLPAQSDSGAKQAHLINPINRMADLGHDREEFAKG